MLVYNIGFINSKGKRDETQLNIEEHEFVHEETIEMFNLILSLKDEMDIQEIVYIDYSGSIEKDG